MTRRGILGLLTGGATFLLTGCGLLSDPSYRFKMTVEVDTPQGLKTGYSVIEVKAIRNTDLMTGSSGSEAVVRGEAVVVDLPGGQPLFALLRTVNRVNDDLATMSMVALDLNFDFKRADSAARIAGGGAARSPAEVPKNYYPLLVTFRDVGDSESVELVDSENLAASFVPGIRLKRITVAVTDEPVTGRIGIILGRFGVERHQSLDKNFKPTTTPTLAQQLAFGDFSKAE